MGKMARGGNKNAKLIVNQEPGKSVTKSKQLGTNLGIVRVVDQMTDDKLGINLCDGKEKSEDMDGLLVSLP